MKSLSYKLKSIEDTLFILVDQLEQLNEILIKQVKEDNIIVDSRIQKSLFLKRIFLLIEESVNGLSLDQIREKTGFQKRKVPSAVFKLKKLNLIEPISRGVYIIKR